MPSQAHHKVAFLSLKEKSSSKVDIRAFLVLRENIEEWGGALKLLFILFFTF